MQQLLGRGLDGVELVFAANDVMAVGALSAIRDAGLTPGTDVAVAGFDDIPTVRDVTPPSRPCGCRSRRSAAVHCVSRSATRMPLPAPSAPRSCCASRRHASRAELRHPLTPLACIPSGRSWRASSAKASQDRPLGESMAADVAEGVCAIGRAGPTLG